MFCPPFPPPSWRPFPRLKPRTRQWAGWVVETLNSLGGCSGSPGGLPDSGPGLSSRRSAHRRPPPGRHGCCVLDRSGPGGPALGRMRPLAPMLVAPRFGVPPSKPRRPTYLNLGPGRAEQVHLLCQVLSHLPLGLLVSPRSPCVMVLGPWGPNATLYAPTHVRFNPLLLPLASGLFCI